jgi:hypothetical protein
MFVHREGCDPQDQSEERRAEAATNQKQRDREQDQHQATATSLNECHRPDSQRHRDGHGKHAADEEVLQHSHRQFTGKNGESFRIGPRLNQ